MTQQSTKLINTLLVSALALSIGSLTPMAYAESSEQKKEIRIMSKGNENAHVSIEANGELTELSLPKDALHDPEKLKAAITDLPKETQDMVLETLTNLPHLVKHDKTAQNTTVDVENEEFKWTEDGAKHKNIMIVEIDDEHGKKTTKKLIHKSTDVEQKHLFINDEDTSNHSEIIKHLIERGTFSSQELDELVKALDAKR